MRANQLSFGKTKFCDSDLSLLGFVKTSYRKKPKAWNDFFLNYTNIFKLINFF